MYQSMYSWWQRVVAPRRRRTIRRLGLERLEDRTLLSGDTLLTAVTPAFRFGSAHASGFLAKPDDVQVFRVHLNAKQRLDATLSGQLSGNSLRGVLRLFDGAGIPTVVIGPGSIDQAHKADEFIAVAELEKCRRFLDQLVAHCRGA